MKKMVGALITAYLLGAAYLIAAIFHWHGFHLDHEVKPVDVFTLLVNVSIAVLLQYLFLTKSSNLRVEKDLNIAEAKTLIDLLRGNNEVFLRRLETEIVEDRDWNLCKAQCRSISNAIESLATSLSSSDCGKCRALDAESETLRALKDAFFNYKAIVTSDPPNTAHRPGSIPDQASAYRKLIRLLRELISEVNRH